MKIYDISQEVFDCSVYPGDPQPKRSTLSSMKDGDLYNLSAFSMCAHNGTHIDAPLHFINNGASVSDIDLAKTIGYAFVKKHDGDLCADDAIDIIAEASNINPESVKRILIAGNATITEEAAEVFAKSGILLIGNESQSVGPEDAPMKTHITLLSHGIVLLEGVRLSKVAEGVYLLCAAPLNLSGCDGSPCRAVLIEI